MFSLDKLGLFFILNYLNQLGTVKNHLMLALREVLFAMQATMDMVTQSPPSSLLGSHHDLIKVVLSPAQKALQFTVDQVTPHLPATPSSGTVPPPLREHIVSSIISVIDDEIENTTDLTQERNRLKVEALNTVKQVLLGQIKKGATAVLPLEQAPKKRVRAA